MKTQLQVYARLKPTQKMRIQINEIIQNNQERNAYDNQSIAYEIDSTRNKLIVGQKYNKSGFINNMKETMEFNFTDILDINSSQDEVFQLVAVPVVQNCLDGYNGTIFAYGQTGSGKTYTINGSDSWAYRGIIPRVMTYIFDQIDERKDEYEYNVYASYMEIYNEKAYDLLNEDHLVSPIDQWNKIEFKRDVQGNIHLSNISLHEIDDAKPGIDLLMMGNYIRKQAATPMNQCSSRSHCIFTLTFEAKQIETGNCFVSKLNLVDLAGSERVSKTNHDGALLNEAKNINLSLSYLEQVIVALNEKKKTGQRQHIPYRHSILTTILKDSLGGNCKTVMIANISTDMDNFEESISALRFSQRVGQLENEIHKNTKVDLNAMVVKLEQEKQQLLDELVKYQRIVGDLNDQDNSKYNNKPKSKKSQSQQSFQQQKKQFVANYESEDDNIDLDSQTDNDQELDQILNKVDEFMQDKSDQLNVKNMVEAKLCFRAMKEYHKSTMADYLKELSDISKKLQQYDALLPQVNKQEITQTKDSDITQMAINTFYNQKPPSNRQSLNNQNYHDENIDPEMNQKYIKSSIQQEHQPIIYHTNQHYITSQEANNIDNYSLKSDNQNRKKRQSLEQNQSQNYQLSQQQQSSKYNNNNKAELSSEDLEINLYKNSQQNQQKKGLPLKVSKNENVYSQTQQNMQYSNQNQIQQNTKQDYSYQVMQQQLQYQQKQQIQQQQQFEQGY